MSANYDSENPVFVQPVARLAPGVRVASTLRIGGVSRGSYASLNLGAHCGDQDGCVLKNRAILRSALNLSSEPSWIEQVHGTDIVDASLVGATPVQADGVYTQSVNEVCAIMTADCLPLVLTDYLGKQIMAVHVGWRGLAAGIVENAVQLFDCSAFDIQSWAGPCIGPQKFEVGPEVIEQLGGSVAAYQISENGEGRYYANLSMLVAERLRNCGVMHFSSAKQCTYLNPQHFFSYRREGQTGRMATLIWKEIPDKQLFNG